MAKNQKIAEDLVGQLFDKLGVKDPFEISEDDELVEITVDSPDPGLIIGHHGDTLDSLQLIISLMLAKKLGEYKRVTLEVGDYKKNRSNYLESLAAQTKEKVLSEKREIYLPDLKSWERRIVHLHLQDDPQVISESVGEGKERTLVVKPK